MSEVTRAVVTRAGERPREGWENAGSSAVTWFTLFSRDITPTAGLTAGVAELPPGGGRLQLHRHEQAELYFVLQGSGTLWIDGVQTTVTAGSAAFIPGNAEHGLENSGDSLLKLLYVFPTDSFADVVYRLSE